MLASLLNTVFLKYTYGNKSLVFSLLLCATPLYEYTMIYLSILLMVDFGFYPVWGYF